MNTPVEILPSDAADPIGMTGRTRAGQPSSSFGVQFKRDLLAGGSPERLERHAIIFGDETRASFVAKLRRLAAVVESGQGAVYGDDPLQGHEINAADFPPLDPAKHDRHSDGFVPEVYEVWRADAMRMLTHLAKTMPLIRL